MNATARHTKSEAGSLYSLPRTEEIASTVKTIIAYFRHHGIALKLLIDNEYVIKYIIHCLCTYILGLQGAFAILIIPIKTRIHVARYKIYNNILVLLLNTSVLNSYKLVLRIVLANELLLSIARSACLVTL